jgi:hypothetical protein
MNSPAWEDRLTNIGSKDKRVELPEERFIAMVIQEQIPTYRTLMKRIQLQ